MTDYTELDPVALVGIGLAQLGEAQDAYWTALHGGEIVLTRPEVDQKMSLRGDAAKAHATWLLESAHAHFRGALAVDMAAESTIDYGDDPDEWEDDADTEDPGVTGDDPPAN